jgi:hypothetical protein
MALKFGECHQKASSNSINSSETIGRHVFFALRLPTLIMCGTDNGQMAMGCAFILP